MPVGTELQCGCVESMVSGTSHDDDSEAPENGAGLIDEDGTNTDAVGGHRFFLRMRDDGTTGDAVASDRVFTRRLVLKESSGPVYFEVHASFAKVEPPVRSAPLAVDVRQ